jgi:NADH:ubiquinone oxidoreductase subunit C
MNADRVLEILRAALSYPQLEARHVPLDDTFVTLPPGYVRAAVQVLAEQLGTIHLSAITGVDTGDGIELLYHFWDGYGLTLCVLLPRQEPRIATLTDLIPGAAYYEREVIEMLGVTFEGHPDPRPLLLPDDWSGEAPLRVTARRYSGGEEGEGRG